MLQELFETFLQPFCKFFIKYYLDNPMFRIVLAFLPGLLGLSYPLIVQTIGKLNDQYKSSHIIDLFKKEIIHKRFLLLLKISVVLTILSFVFSIEIFFLAFVSVITLIYYFFKYIKLLLSYSNPNDLFEHKRKEFDKTIRVYEKNNNTILVKSKFLDLWYPLNDLLYYAINNNNRKLENDIIELFIYKCINFIENKDQIDKERIEYPAEIYNSFYDIICTYLKNEDKNHHQHVNVFVGNIFIEGYKENLNPKVLHLNSFRAIWYNLSLVIENSRKDILMRYWKTAHQYCGSLKNLNWDFRNDPIRLGDHQKYINDFIQFHTVLGAYIMYKEDWKILNEMWNHTQTEPTSYHLFPESTGAIFKVFFLFHSQYIDIPGVFMYYTFREIQFDELSHKKDVKYYVCKYSALLFLRFYKYRKPPYFDPLSFFPEIPEPAQRELWIKELVFFKKLLEEHLSNSEMLRDLELEKLTDLSNLGRIKTPIQYIDEYVSKISNAISTQISTERLDPAKITVMDNFTVKQIEDAYNDIKRINNQIEIKNNEKDEISNKNPFVTGTKSILDRRAFLENHSIHFFNADTIIGESIKINYYYHFSLKIALQKKVTYKVPIGQSFRAIDKLKLDPKDFVIINTGINLQHIRDYYKVDLIDPVGKEDYIYNSMPIYTFKYMHPFSHIIYVIHKDDLPWIKHIDIGEVYPKYNGKVIIDNDLKVYRIITELNNNVELKNFYLKQGKTESDLKDQIEVEYNFLGCIWFRNNTKIVEIKESELFQEGGEVIDIEEIEPFTR